MATNPKELAGYKAVDDHVKSGMIVGLGTGSTAFFAVERLAQKLNSGELKDIVGIPTSERTRDQATTARPRCAISHSQGEFVRPRVTKFRSAPWTTSTGLWMSPSTVRTRSTAA
jgi:hypothetical protein